MLKTVAKHFFCGNLNTLFFRILWIESSKEPHLFEMEIFCNIIKAYTITSCFYSARWIKLMKYLKKKKTVHTADGGRCGGCRGDESRCSRLRSPRSAPGADVCRRTTNHPHGDWTDSRGAGCDCSGRGCSTGCSYRRSAVPRHPGCPTGGSAGCAQ